MKIYASSFFILLFTVSLLSCQTSSDDMIDPGSEYELYGTPFDVPASQDATIYQINVRAFSEEGNLQGVIEKLDYIQSLGVNVIYLMPIYPIGVEKAIGSPYAVKNYKAVNPRFGTLEDLRTLVKGAHEREMAVILDWVPNHTAWDHEWIDAHPEYYEKDEEGNIIAPPGTGWTDVASLNYNNPELRAAMIDAMSYWVHVANIDGFRVDTADFVPYSFWKEALKVLENIEDSDLLMLAEGARTDHFKAGFDYIFGFHFFETLKDVFQENAPVTTLQQTIAEEYEGVYDESKRVVHYTSNHDVNLTDGTPLELFGGKEGSIAAFVVAAYMKAVPMIYNGQEIGYDERIDFFEFDPIDWSMANEDILKEYKQIIAFRNDSKAIRRGELKMYSSEDVVVFTMEHENEKVLVLSNLRNRERTYILPAIFTETTWENAFNGSSISLNKEVVLEPFSYLVLFSTEK